MTQSHDVVSFRSTPASALATKATSKVPLSPRAPWDTRQRPSRAPSTPIRPTVTKAPSPTSRCVSACPRPPVAGSHLPQCVTLLQVDHPPLDLLTSTQNIGTKKQTNTNNPKTPRWAFFFCFSCLCGLEELVLKRDRCNDDRMSETMALTDTTFLSGKNRSCVHTCVSYGTFFLFDFSSLTYLLDSSSLTRELMSM